MLALLRHANLLNALRQVIHQNPVGTIDRFARITVFVLLTRHIQRLIAQLNFRCFKTCVVLQRGKLVRYCGVLQSFRFRRRLICRFWRIAQGRAQIVEIGP
ncbi:Uncharacterised protein [Shigella sonnei]|nr:Uncharacterised protein [Shigella sonnei]CSR49311.1 Uncharacterised protein [Shigella sonnei]